MEPTKIDMLFAAKAVSKEVDARVKALEDECKAELADEYRSGGSDRKRSPMFGDEAGYMTIVKQKPVPSEHVTRLVVDDPQGVIDWMDETRPETDGFAADNLEAFARWHFGHTGELPGGCAVDEYDTEPVEAGVKSVTLKVDSGVVLPLLRGGALAGEVNRLLLGEGE